MCHTIWKIICNSRSFFRLSFVQIFLFHIKCKFRISFYAVFIYNFKLFQILFKLFYKQIWFSYIINYILLFCLGVRYLISDIIYILFAFLDSVIHCEQYWILLKLFYLLSYIRYLYSKLLSFFPRFTILFKLTKALSGSKLCISVIYQVKVFLCSFKLFQAVLYIQKFFFCSF